MSEPSVTTTDAAKPGKIGIILFEQFETLDVFGPVQMLGRLPDYGLFAISEHGSTIRSSQGLPAGVHYSFATAPQMDGLLVPGGQGTRREVANAALLDFLRRQSEGAAWVASVCTGAALLAKAGILDGRRATTNKIAFEWVAAQSTEIDWQRRARWVVDGKFWTSSGVSAGTDMALALVEHFYGRATASETARRAEYVWRDDPSDDPFAAP